jgi:O-antigen/teichoic acid export membrane protein
VHARSPLSAREIPAPARLRMTHRNPKPGDRRHRGQSDRCDRPSVDRESGSRPIRSATALVGRLRASSLAGNSLNIMLTSVISAVLGYGYWTLAARLMAPSVVGVGSALISTMVILSLAVHLGPGAGLISRLSQRGEDTAWRETVLGVLLAGVVLTAALAAIGVYLLSLLVPAFSALLHSPGTAIWFVIGAVSWTSSGLLDYLFIAARRAGLMTIRNATTAVIKLAALVVLPLASPGLGAQGLLITWALGGVAGTAVGLWCCHRRIRALRWVSVRGMSRELLTLTRSMAGHHLISGFGLLPTYLLPVVVTARLGPEQNAYFYVSWMVGSSIFMISPAVGSALFAEGSHDQATLRLLASRSLRTIPALLVLPAATVIVLGDTILSMFGQRYTVGLPLLIVLVLSAFPDAISNISVAILRVRDALALGTVLNATIAIIALAGAWFATAKWGILGAGLAWLAAQLLGALVVFLLPAVFLPGSRYPDRHRRLANTDSRELPR